MKRLRQEIINVLDEMIERFDILESGIKRIGERIDKHRQDCEKIKRDIKEMSVDKGRE